MEGVNDAENNDMTKHIITFVCGWNPNYSDPNVLNAAISRYFVSKRQEEQYKQQNKHEAEKKKRASYERKKEKSKRRRLALDSQPINDVKKASIRAVLTAALMSTDEECEEGFITHQPSWQSTKFREYKEKLDGAYKDSC